MAYKRLPPRGFPSAFKFRVDYYDFGDPNTVINEIRLHHGNKPHEPQKLTPTRYGMYCGSLPPVYLHIYFSLTREEEIWIKITLVEPYHKFIIQLENELPQLVIPGKHISVNHHDESLDFVLIYHAIRYPLF